MATVIIRHQVDIEADGMIRYDDRPSTFEAAETISGRRLDRRRNYCIIGDEVCETVSWTENCSGCCGDELYAPGPGSGCHECGYTGKSRRAMWVPLSICEIGRIAD